MRVCVRVVCAVGSRVILKEKAWSGVLACDWFVAALPLTSPDTPSSALIPSQPLSVLAPTHPLRLPRQRGDGAVVLACRGLEKSTDLPAWEGAV